MKESEIPFSEKLIHFDLISIISELINNKFEGRLIIDNDEAKRELYFKEGNLSFIKSELITDSFLHYTREVNLFNEETIKRVEKCAFENNISVIDSILKLNLAKKDNLIKARVEHQRWLFGKLISLSDGNYEIIKMTGVKQLLNINKRSFLYDWIISSVIKMRNKEKIVEEIKNFIDKDDFIVKSGFCTIDDFDHISKVKNDLTKVDINDEQVVCELYVAIRMKLIFNRASHDNYQEILSHLSRLENKNYFEILGMDENSSSSEIKQSYFNLAKRFHPDKSGFMHGIERFNAERLFAMINEAYANLSSDEKIKEYKKSMKESAINRQRDEKLGRIFKSEENFNLGIAFLKDKNYTKANQYFKDAIKENPDIDEYHSHYAWTYFKMVGGAKSEGLKRHVRELFDKALKINSKNAKTFLYMGYFEKEVGNATSAREHFMRARGLDKNCAEATLELRLLEAKK